MFTYFCSDLPHLAKDITVLFIQCSANDCSSSHTTYNEYYEHSLTTYNEYMYYEHVLITSAADCAKYKHLDCDCVHLV